MVPAHVHRPRDWRTRGQRLVLRFGAVDYKATVYVNGRQVAAHTGGFTAFSADVTDALKPGGAQELIVGVEDPTDIGRQAVGKQRKPGDGIFYTPASGIWQTVWMEPVSAGHVEDLTMTPDLAGRGSASPRTRPERPARRWRRSRTRGASRWAR